MRPVVLPLPGNGRLAAALVDKLNAELGQQDVRRFPDGDTYVRIDTPIAKRSVVLVCTLDRPDDKFLPLLFTAATARDLGATHVGLVCPYLAYMRQDRRFRPGEGITSSYFAKMLSGSVDWLVTIDPHLHRRSSLSEIYSVPSLVLHAAPLISRWIKQNVHDSIVIGPDRESEQWVASVAQGAGVPHLVLDKNRHGDRDVEVSTSTVDGCTSHTPVLVDDIISTGHTMIETVRQLRHAGLAPPICVGVHGIFAGDAYRELHAAGAERVVTCNTISHESNAIDLTDILCDAARRIGDDHTGFVPAAAMCAP